MPGEFTAATGATPFTSKPGYATYKSPYGPKYTIQPNVNGITLKTVTKLGLTLGAFGGAAGIFVVFFFSDIPRFRRDVMQKIPLIGDRFVKDIPASDNPF